VPFLTLGRSDQLDAIYRESHALWGSGLTLEDYTGLWHDLRRTEWGGRHAGFHVWVDDRGQVLSSVKLYHPRVRVAGQTSRATVIGALFTPAALRRRGHASDLVRAVLARARDRDDRIALLFTDIGTDYYAAFGFLALPAEEDRAALPVEPGAPTGWSLRPMSEGDMEAVRDAHHEACLTRPLAVIRDVDHWRFLDARTTRFFERLGDPRVRPRRQIALDHGRFAGYLLTLEGRREWNVREIGVPGGDPEAMAAVLRLGAAQARRDGLRGFHGWLPPGVEPHLRDWRIRTRPRRRAVPMVLALRASVDLSGVAGPDRAYVPFQDQF
jgi:predicted N-acetyltransferase YhbS